MQHLRTVFDFENRRTIESICEAAQDLKNQRRDKCLTPSLSGRVMAMIFEKPSTRTRASFEAGMALLGGSSIVMQARDTQSARGELLRDAARVVGSYVDALVVRSFAQQTVESYARHAGVPVISGGSERDHPCQIATDLFTVYSYRENPWQLTWAFVGDQSRMANGYIAASALLGFPLRIAMPEGAEVDAEYLKRARSAGADITLGSDPAAAVLAADVIATDRWREGTELVGFCIDAKLLECASDNHLVLHPLPAERGKEITDDVLEGRHAVAFHQAGNRLPVQQAILRHLLLRN